ncbi:HAD family acid phosphatase [Nocardioides terrisoli]|uniref:HAD family acid phosphatase n=1 Tax=Nocardioides terrisoli TaxID=3388267 RepID=UPI00287BC3B2|nr:HAD family acid phosphatase [Nocardioides marmorisolisilvae]
MFTLPRRARTVSIVAASVAATVSLTLTGSALASTGHTHQPHAVPAPPAQPTSADQIQNVDQVKTAIKAYYGDTKTTTPAPGDPGVTLHQFSPDGAYAAETSQIADRARAYLRKEAHLAAKQPQRQSTKPAILFDVDDTTLNTYSYEIYSNFVYNPATNASFVNAGSATVFPAVPGMPQLEAAAVKHGYTVFFLTGRPASQLDGTEANLTDAGYTWDGGNIYLKDQTKPWLSSCAPTCTTIQYKSLTRKYIESQGYDIVANFGDQFSDLKGGYADKTFKIPNPMYYLP